MMPIMRKMNLIGAFLDISQNSRRSLSLSQ